MKRYMKDMSYAEIQKLETRKIAEDLEESLAGVLKDEIRETNEAIESASGGEESEQSQARNGIFYWQKIGPDMEEDLLQTLKEEFRK